MFYLDFTNGRISFVNFLDQIFYLTDKEKWWYTLYHYDNIYFKIYNIDFTHIFWNEIEDQATEEQYLDNNWYNFHLNNVPMLVHLKHLVIHYFKVFHMNFLDNNILRYLLLVLVNFCLLMYIYNVNNDEVQRYFTLYTYHLDPFHEHQDTLYDINYELYD